MRKLCLVVLLLSLCSIAYGRVGKVNLLDKSYEAVFDRMGPWRWATVERHRVLQFTPGVPCEKKNMPGYCLVHLSKVEGVGLKYTVEVAFGGGPSYVGLTGDTTVLLDSTTGPVKLTYVREGKLFRVYDGKGALLVTHAIGEENKTLAISIFPGTVAAQAVFITSVTLIFQADGGEKERVLSGKAGPEEDGERRVVEGVGIGNVVIGATVDEILEALGPPDKRGDAPHVWLEYRKSRGIDIIFPGGTAKEIRFNPGFPHPLKRGPAIGTALKDVLKAYGDPLKMVQTDQAGFDDKVLYQLPKASKIAYQKEGVLFWFDGNAKVSQFVVFPKQGDVAPPAPPPEPPKD